MRNTAKEALKKLSAAITASAVVLSLSFTGAALPPEKEADGYYVPSVSDFESVAGWWSENIPSVSEAERGVTLTYNGGDIGRAVPMMNKYNFDGLSLRFDNLTKNAGCTGALRFAVVLSSVHSGIGAFRLQFDTSEGTLSYLSNLTGYTDPTPVITSDALKYESLSENEFSLSLNSTSAGNLLCTVTAGDTEFSGEIPYSFIQTCQSVGQLSLNADNTYVKIAPGKNFGGDDYYFSVDMTGIAFDPYTLPTSSVLTPRNESSNISFASVPNGVFPRALLCRFDGVDIGGRFFSSSRYDINGLCLRFSELKKLEGHEDEALKLAVTFTAAPGVSIGTVRVMIDTSSGGVYYWGGTVGANAQKIAESDALLYDNLAGKDIELLFEIDEEKNLICYITAGGAEVTAVLPSGYFTNLGTENACFEIGPGNSVCYFTVKLTGVRSAKHISFLDGGGSELARAAVNAGSWINPPEVNAEEGSLVLGWENLADNELYGFTAYQVSDHAVYRAVTGIIGDADLDGGLSGDDLAILRKSILGSAAADFPQLLDVNSDNEINILDMVRLKKRIAGAGTQP